MRSSGSRQRPQPAPELPAKKNDRKKILSSPRKGAPRKLGYLQQREMQALPQKIEALEADQKRLFAILSDPLFYKKAKEEIAGVKSDLSRIEQEIETAYRRWEELEALKSSAEA